jgi:hypoxanthine phosphoribosyltransferase
VTTLEPLFSSEEIGARVLELGQEITTFYRKIGAREVVAVGVLKGSVLFLADLVRQLDLDVRIEVLGVSSYEGTSSTGNVRITHDLRADITGRHVLLVEDIVDTGLTLEFLRKVLEVREPSSLCVASLLDKPSRRKVTVDVDFVGFTIPDRFVVGYGLDFEQRYRQLPYIAVVKNPHGRG